MHNDNAGGRLRNFSCPVYESIKLEIHQHGGCVEVVKLPLASYFHLRSELLSLYEISKESSKS